MLLKSKERAIVSVISDCWILAFLGVSKLSKTVPDPLPGKYTAPIIAHDCDHFKGGVGKFSKKEGKLSFFLIPGQNRQCLLGFTGVLGSLLGQPGPPPCCIPQGDGGILGKFWGYFW